MFCNELWRYISLFLDKPYYILYLNKSFKSLKSASNTWLLPQYIKTALIGNNCSLNELAIIMRDVYNKQSNSINICYFINDLSSIFDNIYNMPSYTYYYKCNKWKKKHINIRAIKLIIRSNITTFTSKQTIKSFANCKIHEVYRLPMVVVRLMNSQNMLQVKALIY